MTAIFAMMGLFMESAAAIHAVRKSWIASFVRNDGVCAAMTGLLYVNKPVQSRFQAACWFHRRCATEFLTARQLPLRAEMAGAYVDALDAQKLVVASPAQAVLQRRWRVRDNMPGTRDFCPVIRQTAQALTMMALDVPALLQQLALEFGDELLMRSAAWMTLREGKASFALEGEADQPARIGRFADALAHRCGQGAPPLDHATLAELQSDSPLRE